MNEGEIVDYYGGLDLGQAHDFTALSVVEVALGARAISRAGYLKDVQYPHDEWRYSVTHLERFPLGTPYPQIVASVSARMEALPLAGKGSVEAGMARRVLAIDGTGVGRPVVDLLKGQRVDNLVPITIHGGDAVTYQDGYYRVPKRDLVAGLQMLMQQRRLRVAEGLPEARTLIGELRDYRYKLTATAHDTYNAREGAHDDLVLALAVAVWAAQHHSGGHVTEEARTIIDNWID